MEVSIQDCCVQKIINVFSKKNRIKYSCILTKYKYNFHCTYTIFFKYCIQLHHFVVSYTFAFLTVTLNLLNTARFNGLKKITCLFWWMNVLTCIRILRIYILTFSSIASGNSFLVCQNINVKDMEQVDIS